MTTIEYTDALARLRAAARAYYSGSDTLMADAEYDELARAVAEHEERHGIDGASAHVAAGAVSGDVRHTAPMLSLDNVFSATELADWLAATTARVGGDRVGYIVEPKLDGIALALTYSDGRAVRAVTRGDGTAGQDVTAVLPSLTTLPSPAGFTGEVRGEALFSRDQFADANAARRAAGAREFANARNGAAGAVNGAGSRSEALLLSFVAYDVIGLDGAESHWQAMSELDRLGFITAESVLPVDLRRRSALEPDEVAELVSAMGSRRHELDFEVDGMVVKVNRHDLRARAGSSGRAPYWAIAFKFPPEEVSTRLLGWDAEVGRTGVITPRAILEPVSVGGVTVTYATLHNFDDVTAKDIRVGDTVTVVRAGDVIPRVAGPLVALRDGTERPIVAPATCPNCAGPVARDGARVKCLRGIECSVERNVEYAVSRDALDIDGLGPAQVSALVASGLVGHVGDLFDLTVEQLAALPGVKRYADTPANRKAGRVGEPVPLGETTAARIHAQIQASTSQPLARVLTALAIPGTGRSLCRALSSHFRDMASLLAATPDELAEVEMVGAVKAAGIHDVLARKRHVVDALARAGFDLTEPARVGPAPLAGMTVVVTGAMTGPLAGSRTEVTERLTRLGAKVSGSVSATTSLLICPDPDGSGSKLAAARRHGVRILTESDFADEFLPGG